MITLHFSMLALSLFGSFILGWAAGILWRVFDQIRREDQAQKTFERAQAKADRMMALMREIGMSPEKAIYHPVTPAITKKWATGEINDVQLMGALKNLLEMNPGLRP